MIEQQFTIAGDPELEIRIESGRVELIEGDPGVVQVSVETNDQHFVVTQRGDTVEIYSNPEARWSSSRANVLVRVVPGTIARIRTASADVDSEVFLRKAEVKAASGNIELRGVDIGAVKTASGQIAIGKVKKSLKVATASGDVELGEVTGSIDLSTASGDVRIGSMDATIELNTVSGDVTVDRFQGSHASFKTMSGNVTLGIPTGTKIDLDATALSGRVNLPPAQETRSKVKREMSLKVKSVSGDLTLNRVSD